MITEDFVSFDVAKLLKEKGFEYNPDESYWLIDANNKMYWVSCIGAYEYVDVPTKSFQRPKNGYRLVTQAMAMKWLREVHNIFITITFRFSRNADNDINFSYYAEKYENHYGYGDGEFNSYEEACEAAINYCLEKLI